MLVLLGIGFLAGVITAVSPCILPVLPIVLAGGASGTARRPFAIIAGLVASFTLFTLAAASILSALGLPDDLLRNLAIAALFVLAASLLFPRFAYWLERPFAFMTRRRAGDLGGGFVLGVSLGLVFVPCAGPVLATITALSAQHKLGAESVLLTIAYALGAAVPMLLIALGGQRAARRLRAQSQNFRRAMGVLLAGAALALVFNTSQSLQTALGGYTTSIQKHVEETSLAQKHLDSLRGGGNAFAKAAAKVKSDPDPSVLPELGTAPDFAEDLRLAEHAGRPCGIARVAARQGRARRLLDVLVHQLPAYAAAPARVVRGVPQGRLRDRRRAHAGVRIRACARQRAPGDARPGRHVAGRARQRLRNVERILEPVLAR